MDYSFEKMSESHRGAVIDIFNYFIKHTFAAYLDEAVDDLFFGRFLAMSRGYPALVIKTGHHQVVGFGFMRPHYLPASSRRAAEVTYFILPENSRKGLGTALLDLFVQEAGRRGIDTLLANICSRNEESIRFHLKNGFQESNRFTRVGRKFKADFDVVWMERQLK
jgi:L-amino acid N-acyltransferase YncA